MPLDVIKQKHTIRASDVAKNYTLIVETRIVGLRWLKFRFWIAIQLCKIAAWIGGIGLEINQEVGVLVTEEPGKELTKK